MLLFEFDEALLRFNVQTPAFEELFQLPLTIGHMLRRLPFLPAIGILFGPVGHNPAANHSA